MAGMSLQGAGSFLDAVDDTRNQLAADDVWVVGTNVEYAIAQEFGDGRTTYTPHVRPGVRDTGAKMGRIAADSDGLADFLRRTAFHLEGNIKRKAPVATGRLRSSYSAQKIE